MFQFFANRRFLIGALIFLIITWMLFITSQPRAREGHVEYFLNSAIAPLESVFGYLGGTIGDTWNTVTRLAQLKNENDAYRKEINEIKARQLELEALRKENIRLRDALQFQTANPSELVSAEVIATSPSNWNKSIIINKGRNAGLRKNMGVITPRGVVGRINWVRATTAEVVLINDPREGNVIGGVVDRNRIVVIVAGGGRTQDECTVKPAIDSYFIDLKKKDLIVTAENSEIFPRGLPIGRISHTSKGANQMVSEASLRPMVDLGRLQIVYVIKTKR